MLRRASRTARRGVLFSAATLVLAGCGFFTRVQGPAASPRAPERKVVERRLAAPSMPPDSEGRAVLRAATKARGKKILVSTEDRWLWYVSGTDTLMSVPVAVGMGKDFTFQGKRWHFATPRGRRKVLLKRPNPIWTVPEWHYYERSAQEGLKLVKMVPGRRYTLSDGTYLIVRGTQVGRVNQFGNFWAIDPGIEIIFDKTLFVPPVNSAQRRVPNALGPYKLDMGDGYLIHGTHIYNEDSIGEAVSHGCVRLRNEDVTKLYAMVPVGTPVYIF